MSDIRFDVAYGPGLNQIDIQPHFCREWDGDEGCYGTNPNHGFTFDEARAEVVSFYQGRIAEWAALTYEKWMAENTPAQDEQDDTATQGAHRQLAQPDAEGAEEVASPAEAVLQQARADPQAKGRAEEERLEAANGIGRAVNPKMHGSEK